MMENTLIEIKNLSKSYTLRTPFENDNQNKVLEVLKGINLSVKAGEIIGVVGPNGCGKSTLLKILSSVTPPTGGDIYIKGKVASILDIGAGFHPELTGRENVYLHGQILGFTKKEIEASFDEIVEFSEIGKFIDQPVKTYSNGMYLRLAFSVIIHLKCDVLLLDEVLAVGDQYFMRKCLNVLRQKKEEGLTIVIVSHDIELLIAICSKIIAIEKGSIVEKETFIDLFPKFEQDEKVNLKKIEHIVENETLEINMKLSDVKDYNWIDIGLIFDGSSSVHSRFSLTSLHNQTKSSFELDGNEISFQMKVPIYSIKPDKYTITLAVIKDRKAVSKLFQNCYYIDLNYDENILPFLNFYPNPLRLFADWRTLQND
ncbi:MAG: ABC transporter ATP-binding protein [Chitinophagales bacterium]|nr:ABC transporter ATP-binding protein [Chitinophagales bacterium]MCZ2392449.1 ABC transporter ATP-binding protein [Chitinophagales bacterium]